MVLSACGASPPAAPTFDLLIMNGTIVDGSGAPAYEGDIAVVGDKIVELAREEGWM